MNYDFLYEGASDRVVRAGLIGVGEFGHSLIGQSLLMDQLEVRALADRDMDRAAAVLAALGIKGEDVRLSDSVSSATAALEAGKYVVVPDGALLADLPIDVVVEATGSPEGGAANALAAISAGKHVAMVSKEADSVVGPILAKHARQAGVICTPIEGDQPGLLIGLLSYVRLIGLPVVAAGKSSEYDFVWHPDTGTVSWLDETIAAPGLAACWDIGDRNISEVMATRDALLSELPQQRAPDINEMLLVANHTGLKPDTPHFHRPIARTIEVPSILCPNEDGGLLSDVSPRGPGRLDVFNCLRRADEASFAGGVYVVVDGGHDPETWRVLAEKGHPVSRCGRYGLVYNPQHLLGIEATVSILSAGLLGRSTGAAGPRPVLDMIAVAGQNLTAGTALVMDRRHNIIGVEAEMIDAGPIAEDGALPYYMVAGNVLTRDVSAGDRITRSMILSPEGSILWRLRAEQDASFFAA